MNLTPCSGSFDSLSGHKKPFYQSRPDRFLAWSVLVIAVLTVFLPYIPLGKIFGFLPLPPVVLTIMVIITVIYVALSEIIKRRFYKRTA
ncbi:MAG: cation transporting ATPase C-terminal domain-containing protein [Proteobacteria bacterium]|nr:cation transporting ATPase C-terminal domain-containing protein [Pseudomonadota bacterium]MBU1648592.1 cation transporting ATPase C-terminal domain-containing protein [Pseudomonadota bacterium]MBU1985862.1 cation transporting ATPase C-terminal domain-containing protein [Pseudomonadota bacterium]